MTVKNDKSSAENEWQTQKLRKLVTSYKTVVFMWLHIHFGMAVILCVWSFFHYVFSFWAHVVTELYNLSEEINLSFYFLSVFDVPSCFYCACVHLLRCYFVSLLSFLGFVIYFRSLVSFFLQSGCVASQSVDGAGGIECVWFDNHLSNVAATANAFIRIHRRFMSPWCAQNVCW